MTRQRANQYAYDVACWAWVRWVSWGARRRNDLQVNPVILGSERLFDGFDAGKPDLELERVLQAPGVAHLRFRVIG